MDVQPLWTYALNGIGGAYGSNSTKGFCKDRAKEGSSKEENSQEISGGKC